MVVFIDLDGTLINTADIYYKNIKDGLIDFNLSDIPIFPKAIEFISRLKTLRHRIIILSDSHPKYVRPIVETFF